MSVSLDPPPLLPLEFLRPAVRVELSFPRRWIPGSLFLFFSRVLRYFVWFLFF